MNDLHYSRGIWYGSSDKWEISRKLEWHIITSLASSIIHCSNFMKQKRADRTGHFVTDLRRCFSDISRYFHMTISESTNLKAIRNCATDIRIWDDVGILRSYNSRSLSPKMEQFICWLEEAWVMVKDDVDIVKSDLDSIKESLSVLNGCVEAAERANVLAQSVSESICKVLDGGNIEPAVSLFVKENLKKGR